MAGGASDHAWGLGWAPGMLVQGTPGQLSDAGGLRDRIVVVGKPGSGFAEARFVPPPPGDQLKAGAEDLITWIDQPLTSQLCSKRRWRTINSRHCILLRRERRPGDSAVIVQLLGVVGSSESSCGVSGSAAPRALSGRSARTELHGCLGSLGGLLCRGRSGLGERVAAEGRARSLERSTTPRGGSCRQTRGRERDRRRIGRRTVRHPHPGGDEPEPHLAGGDDAIRA